MFLLAHPLVKCIDKCQQKLAVVRPVTVLPLVLPAHNRATTGITLSSVCPVDTHFGDSQTLLSKLLHATGVPQTLIKIKCVIIKV